MLLKNHTESIRPARSGDKGRSDRPAAGIVKQGKELSGQLPALRSYRNAFEQRLIRVGSDTVLYNDYHRGTPRRLRRICERPCTIFGWRHEHSPFFNSIATGLNALDCSAVKNYLILFMSLAKSSRIRRFPLWPRGT